jgi:hypothetical protein
VIRAVTQQEWYGKQLAGSVLEFALGPELGPLTKLIRNELPLSRGILEDRIVLRLIQSRRPSE